MTGLAAHGIEVTLPSGWEGRVFRRPSHGEVAASAADGPAAPAGEATHAVVHLSTIPLPPDLGDFGSAAVPSLGADDVLVVLFEYGPESVSQPMFARAGVPRTLGPDDFSPGVLQRAVRGQAGAQVFCNEAGRAFCLYVVLGAYANRQRLIPRVNAVLGALTIGPGGGASGTASAANGAAPSRSTTTTAPPSTTTPAPITPAPATPAPATPAPATTAADPSPTSTTSGVQPGSGT